MIETLQKKILKCNVQKLSYFTRMWSRKIVEGIGSAGKLLRFVIESGYVGKVFQVWKFMTERRTNQLLWNKA